MESHEWHIVDFKTYCPKCKHAKKDQAEEPCNTCLEYGGRELSEVPEKFEEAKS